MDNNEKGKGGFGIIILDCILLVYTSYFFLSDKMHIIFTLLIGVGVSLVLVLLLRIPIIGHIIKLICGLGFASVIFIVIENNTGGNIGGSGGGKGAMSKLLESGPIWWWTIVILVSLISLGLHFAACKTRPLPKKKPQVTFQNHYPSNSNLVSCSTHDEFEDVEVLPQDLKSYTPQGRSEIHPAEKMVIIFNSAQKHYTDIQEIISDFETESFPEEFIAICQKLDDLYKSLENRMKAYMELLNDSDNIRIQEMADDINEKANAVDTAVVQVESALRLLEQSKPKANHQSSFFQGCDTTEKLNKRFRNLTKTYHPDIDTGDEETMKHIVAEYEKVKSELSEHQF